MASAANHAVDKLVNQLPELKTPADKALMARVTRFFADAIVDLTPTDKTAALQARGDILAVIETLARRPAEQSAIYAVKLRGAVLKRKILNAEGGVIGPSDAAKLLNISRQTVSQRRIAGKLLGVPVAGGFAYPVWQFEDGETWTCKETLEKIRGTAGELRNLGVKPGDFVLAWMPSGQAMIRSWFAGLLVGQSFERSNVVSTGWRGLVSELSSALSSGELTPRDS